MASGTMRWWAACATALACTAPAAATITVRDLVRLEGYGESEISGIGIVTGLPGTGDGNDFLPMARKLSAIYAERGAPVLDLGELITGQNSALVHVSVTVPAIGGRRGDELDVRLSSAHAADSLAGGQLILTHLLGPLRGQGVYGVAWGDVVVDPRTPTRGTVIGGAQLTRDVDMAGVIGPDGSIRLNLEAPFAGWSNARMLASTINEDRLGLEGLGAAPVARAINERSIRVEIPESDLVDPSGFIGNMLAIRLHESLLVQPGRVVINEARGTIVVSGDVTLLPAVVSQNGLNITVVDPPPPAPTEQNPQVEIRTWATLAPDADDDGRARLRDLLAALEQLDVGAGDRIGIVKTLHRGGFLVAELIVE